MAAEEAVLNDRMLWLRGWQIDALDGGMPPEKVGELSRMFVQMRCLADDFDEEQNERLLAVAEGR